VNRTSARNAWLVFGGVLVVALGVAVWQHMEVLSQVLVAHADTAANTLLVLQAKSFSLDQGHYSRIGLNHPGPGWLAILAAGETLFYDVLHVVPAPMNGQVLGQLVLQAVCIAVVAGVAVALTRRVAPGLLLGGAAYWGMTGWFGAEQSFPPALAQIWPPYASFTLLVAVLPLTVAVAMGRTWFWPPLVLFGGLLVHTHVVFFLIFGALFAGALVAWLIVHRGAIRAELRSHRWAWALSIVAFVAVVLPLAIRTSDEWPNPWAGWIWFTGIGGEEATPGLLLDYFRYSLGLIGIPGWGYGVAAVLAIALLLVWRDRAARRLALVSYGALALVVLLTLLYAVVGIDAFTPFDINAYIVLYALAVPPLFLGTVAVHAGAALAALLRNRAPGREAATRLGATLTAGVVGLALLGLGASSSRGTLTEPAGAGEAVAVAGEIAAYGAEHGPVGLAIVSMDDHDLWADLATVFAQAIRDDPSGAVCADYEAGIDAEAVTLSRSFGCNGTAAHHLVLTIHPDQVAGTVLFRSPSLEGLGEISYVLVG